MPGDLLLALAEDEARQVARVLPADAEVRVDPVALESSPETGEPARLGRPVGLCPADEVGRRRRRRKVGGCRQGHRSDQPPYFATFASCSALVLAKAVSFDPSFLARKYR